MYKLIQMKCEKLSEADFNGIDQKKKKELILTIYTCLFLQSKNFEVEPLSITDVTQHLLKNMIDQKSVINKELEIRKLIGYENETATLFDFIMHFTKVWKIELM